jgi:hypothetical protein
MAPLFNDKNLDGWEIRGDSTWTVLKNGVGQRPQRSIVKMFVSPGWFGLGSGSF